MTETQINHDQKKRNIDFFSFCENCTNIYFMRIDIYFNDM